jgi:N6-adenosine-specific RNA methylase IME4
MVDQASGVIEWLDDPGLLSPNEYSVGIYGEDGFQDLVESIKKLGILQPLYVTTRGMIISGHRRWRAAQVAYQEGVPVPIPVIRKGYPSELDERQATIEFNRYRIKTGQQLYNEGKALRDIEAAKAKLRQEATRLVTRGIQQKDMVVDNGPPPSNAGKTRDIIARAIGLGSGKQWDRLEYIAENAPDFLPDIKPDGITISRAYTQAKQAAQRGKVPDTPYLPAGKYQVIYADPPWPYDNSGLGGSAESHYPTMSLDELAKLDIVSLTGDNGVLFLWVTSPFLPEGLKLCQNWGFQYKSSFIWIKDKSTYGKLGFYNYSQHEFLFAATRGSCLPRSGSLVPSVIVAPKGEHSAKPELVYEIIEKMYPGPYIELFARKRRANWESWGTL